MQKTKAYKVLSYLWGKFGVYPVAALVIFIGIGILNIIPFTTYYLDNDTYSFIYILSAIASTLVRLLDAYALAIVIGITLSLIIHKSYTAEKMLLPFFEIIQSIPALALFPVLVILFLDRGNINNAVILILFLSMLWSIIFNLINGLKSIPRDINYVSQVFKLKGYKYYTEIIFPAMIPYVAVGSFLAWAQGWNIVILAEVLHIFVPNGAVAEDVFGIGSVLINSISNGQTGLFITGLALLVLVIGLINLFIWQKFLTYSERFKFK